MSSNVHIPPLIGCPLLFMSIFLPQATLLDKKASIYIKEETAKSRYSENFGLLKFILVSSLMTRDQILLHGS